MNNKHDFKPKFIQRRETRSRNKMITGKPGRCVAWGMGYYQQLLLDQLYEKRKDSAGMFVDPKAHLQRKVIKKK
ncbi:hypothetical protein NRS6110_04226 [Bacillus subtilis]|uniref:hypothetical protein n=1 Tax=Bacillus subtilis group TaxID=653685 RepID=UPI00119DEF91|nr:MULTISPECIES: hypothetical protein [Bacillus subtilis group]MEC2400514.1 hypothetical protein [Bacillus subtilis]MED4660874.1 hypothetical protein [Bacillus subtilis]MED4667702.1 hypothetical protein [Bacillus subtilis]WEZ26729.1 hypothetical protein P5635_00030 [Bacillus subtilis]CAF1782841.1 hypothetical protein NRS6116_03913 [Bacillus subtilis]